MYHYARQESPPGHQTAKIHDSDDSMRHGENDHGQTKGTPYEKVLTRDRDAENLPQAIPMAKRRHFTASTIMGDCISVLLPAALVAFVIAVWRLDNRLYVEGSLDTWRNAIIVLATAYPILFASIVGRLMAAAAHWNLERGADIGRLETLMGSRAVGSTVLTLIRLRRVTFGAAGILALWAVSPLGAQAFLRMLSTEPRIESAPIDATYFDSTSPSRLGWNLRYGDWYEAQLQLMAKVHSALMLTSPADKKAPADSWGNVKIPFPAGDVGKGNMTTIDEEWHTVGSTNVDYTSFIGVPVSGDFRPGNTTFELESTYMDLQCSESYLDEEMPKIIGYNGFIYDEFDDVYDEDDDVEINNINGTWRGPCVNDWEDSPEECGGEWYLALDTFVSESWQKLGESTPLLTPAAMVGEERLGARATRLLFHSIVWNAGAGRERGQFTTTCRVQQKYVESRVLCIQRDEGLGDDDSPDTQRSCAVVAQRRSRKPHAPEDVSFLSFPSNFYQLAARIPALIGGSGSYSVDLSLHYLFNGSTPVERNLQEEGYELDIEKVSPEVFGRRLSQMLNTYLGATQLKLDAAFGTIPGDSLRLSSTTTTEWFVEYVSVSLGWIVVCLLACVVLLITGIVCVVFSHRARGPEVLGYVSSSVRDSRFLNIPADKQALDGADLTRHIHHHRIKWGVVRTASNLGIGPEHDVDRVK